jgi:DNA-binding CsgD family transcriptional regulator
MPPRLSARQEQCVRLTAFRTDKEIAAYLGISEATVKKHVHEACQRLGVKRRKAALAILDQSGSDHPNDPIPQTAQASVVHIQSAVRPRRDRGPESEPEAHDQGKTVITEGADSGARRITQRSGGDTLFTYAPPPRGTLFRFTMIIIIAIVICTMLVVMGGMVSDLHHILSRFDPRP